MNFTTPEIISCIAIVISLIMGLGGFLATLLIASLGYLIKRTITTIEDKITGLGVKFDNMVAQKEAAHNNIYKQIDNTENKFSGQVNEIKKDVSSINKSIGRLEGAFNKNIIMSATGTHGG